MVYSFICIELRQLQNMVVGSDRSGLPGPPQVCNKNVRKNDVQRKAELS